MLEIDHMSIDFDTGRAPVHVLRDISLTVPAGEIVGIVGESGSGKSTLALAIMRLLSGNARVTAGRIIFDDKDILKLTEDAMREIRGRRIAMVFQDPMTSLNPVRSIGRQMLDIQRHGADGNT
ncbi:ATP-binding cassette domain-containing protein, partial [Aestuariivirga sp.]|uniref:ATP-binding cassette domain-containing protein n=1 Tax=Aestuariivirga sp. TaxID=2650926 RepID=UPI003017E2C0